MKFDGATEPLSGYNQGIEHEHESTSRSRRSPPILPYALPASTYPPTRLIFDVAQFFFIGSDRSELGDRCCLWHQLGRGTEI